MEKELPKEFWPAIGRYVEFIVREGIERRYQGRKQVYDRLRDVPGCWEARNARMIKEELDKVDNDLAGRNTEEDWRTHEAKVIA